MKTFKIDWLSGSDLMGLSEYKYDHFEAIAKSKPCHIAIYLIHAVTGKIEIGLHLAERFTRHHLHYKKTFPIVIDGRQILNWIEKQMVTKA